MWGNTLNIFAIFNKKIPFKYHHLESTDNIIIEQDLITKSKKINSFNNYCTFLKIINCLDQKEREKLY